jgi:asparagine synthase (glutamine-hydrolysing)
MCGFLLTAGPTGPWHHRMLGGLRRRGPDGIGFLADGPVRIAQTRLAILGLDDRSLAPLENDRHVLAFNGEIYNFLSLSREHASDTSALLQAWTRNAPDPDGLLRQLHGFWAFAVYDKARRVISLVRDQFGVKPLYYATTKAGLVAGSTLAAVRSMLPESPSLDHDSLSEYVRYQLPLTDRTFFQGVKRVLPGHVVEYDVASRRVSMRCYEDIWSPDGGRLADDAWVAGAREILTDCVVEATTSDAGYTTTCSGGLDSSLVTRLAEPRIAFHGNFSDPECNETRWAQSALDGSDTRLFVVNCDETTPITERIRSLVEDFDDLAVGSAILPLDDLFRRVRERERVILLGTGGDELFGGYVRYRLVAGECPQDSYRGLFEAMQRADLVSEAMRFEFCHRKGDPRLYRFFQDPLERFFAVYKGPIDFDRRFFLPGLLTIDDRMTGRHGIEGRPALLHQRFVRHVARLHPDEHAGDKPIMRRIARGVLPDDVIGRSDKMGFTTPVGTMINADAHRIREQLTSSRFRDLYDLRRMSFTADTKFSREVWGLVLLDSWLERYA